MACEINQVCQKARHFPILQDLKDSLCYRAIPLIINIILITIVCLLKMLTPASAKRSRVGFKAFIRLKKLKHTY